MLAFFPGVQGKSQSANVKNGIDGGHHNTIVTNTDQISQIANKNNVPYGQIKKIASGGWGSGNSGFGLSQGTGQGQSQGLSQSMNILNQIKGGHHNKILVNGQQAAALGASDTETDSANAGNNTTASNNATAMNLSQILDTQNQILGGHHNMIWVSSVQVAEINALSLGYLSQDANIYNQIAGGHHNVILLGSSQQAYLNSTPN